MCDESRLSCDLENRANCLEEFLRFEGFRQNRTIIDTNSSGPDYISGVATHVQNLQVRADSCKLPAEVPAIHVRDYQITEDQRNRSTMVSELFHGIHCIPRLDNPIAIPFK